MNKAQVAMEYLILTAFILVAVGILFSFSFLNYNQNIQVVKANETVSKMANAVNDIYTKGEGNTRFVNLSLPEGMQKIEIIHKCVSAEPNQGSVSECSGEVPGSYNDIEFSAISMEINLLGGPSTIIRETKAKILEDLGEDGEGDEQNIGSPLFAGSAFTVKVSWTDTGLLKLEKV